MDKPTYGIADMVIKKFGGHKHLARALDISLTTVYRWTYPKGVHGATDGLIPVKHHHKIVIYSNRFGYELKKKDLFPQG